MTDALAAAQTIAAARRGRVPLAALPAGIAPATEAEGYRIQDTLRDLRANARPIALLSVGLVLFTIGVVAVVAHLLIPGVEWPAVFALGAIVAPTDAIAAKTDAAPT